MQKALFPGEATDSDIFDITYKKEGYQDTTIAGVEIADSEIEVNPIINMIPILNMRNDIEAMLNGTVIVDTGDQIQDDDPLENLVITAGDQTDPGAKTEIRGIEDNRKLELKPMDKFIDRKTISIKVSDGSATVQQRFNFKVNGGSEFRTTVVNWEDGKAITDTLHIIAESLDNPGTSYSTITTDGNILLAVLPGKYNIYIRDELEHFDFDPLTGFATRELFEQNKYEYQKIGKWYDRRLDNVDLRQDVNYRKQFMISEELDLNFDESLQFPNLHSAKILAKFDYPTFFWMSAGFRKGQSAYLYTYTGQGDSELKKPFVGWEAIIKGHKVHVFRNKTGREQYQEGAEYIARCRNEINNTHAIETYFKVEKEILDGLNPDWFEFMDGLYSDQLDQIICFTYKPDWAATRLGARYRLDNSTLDEIDLNIDNNLLKPYNYLSAEGEELVKRHIMANIMQVMGFPGRLSEWPKYGAPYTYGQEGGINRATNRVSVGSDYSAIPSSWEKRDRAAILYYYTPKYPENDLDPTHVLVD